MAGQGLLEVLKKGTVEPILIHLRDRLEGIDDLSTDVTNPRFDVVDSADVVKISNGVPTFIIGHPMIAVCLIDTTTGGGWPNDEYRLYFKYSDGSSNPVLYAGKFRVEDD